MKKSAHSHQPVHREAPTVRPHCSQQAAAESVGKDERSCALRLTPFCHAPQLVAGGGLALLLLRAADWPTQASAAKEDV